MNYSLVHIDYLFLSPSGQLEHLLSDLQKDLEQQDQELYFEYKVPEFRIN